MQVGDKIKVTKTEDLPAVVAQAVAGRVGTVTEIADRDEVIAQFKDDQGRFSKRFRRDEVTKVW